MKTQAKLLLAGVAIAVAGAATVVPVFAKGRSDAIFEQFDANNDGFVDKAEVTAAQDKQFAEADADGDGALTAEELKAHRDARRAEHMNKAEGRKGPNAEEAFKAMDADGNGSINQEELAAHMEKRGEARGEHRKDRAGKRGHDRRASMMERLDADKDGKITRAEIGDGFATRMFERLDTDEDGRISKAEAEAARGGSRKHRSGN